MAPSVQEIWGPQGVGIPTAARTDLGVQLKILKALRALQHGEESYGDDPLGEPVGVLPGTSEFGPSGRGERRKREGSRRLRRRRMLLPHLIVQEYLHLARERLGVVAGTASWHAEQYPTKIRPRFGESEARGSAQAWPPKGKSAAAKAAAAAARARKEEDGEKGDKR